MTIREQAEELIRAYKPTDSEWRHIVVQLLAALAAQEAPPQPEIAREWFEKGYQKGLEDADPLRDCICDGGPQGEGMVSIPHEPHCPLAACRQEQP